MESSSQHSEFTKITSSLIYSWEKRLIEENPNITHLQRFLISDDAVLFEDLPPLSNHRILHGDIERTYRSISNLIPNFKDTCLKLLTYYCTTNSIQYIQGMNEIIGTFILLKSKINISYARIYNLFICFIDFFIPNYYNRTDVTALQASFHLLNLLLKYHDPFLYELFTKNLITPELYASSWLLTMFANKWSLNVIYRLWDKLILFGDKVLPHFIILATLFYYKSSYIHHAQSKINEIANYLCQLHISDTKDIDKIIDLALELNKKTPVSYRMLAYNMKIFDAKYVYINEIVKGFDIEKVTVMPIYFSEIVKCLFPSKVKCFDNKCECYVNKFCYEGNVFCGYCSYAYSNLSEVIDNYVIVDLRADTPQGIQQECDYLNNRNAIIVKCNKYYDNMITEITDSENKEIVTYKINDTSNMVECIYNDIVNTVNSHKSDNNIIESNEWNHHIILLTSFTNYYEEHKYIEGLQIKTEISNLQHLTITKSFFDNDYPPKTKTKNLNKFYYLEQIVLNSLQDYLSQTKQMKYISFAYGGYWKLHDLCLKYQLDNTIKVKKCKLCKLYLKHNPLFKEFIINGQFIRNEIVFLKKYPNVNYNNVIDNKRYFHCHLLHNKWLSKIIFINKTCLVMFAEVDQINGIYKCELIIQYDDIYQIKEAFAYKKILIFLKDINSFICFPQLITLEFKTKGGTKFYNKLSHILASKNNIQK